METIEKNFNYIKDLLNDKFMIKEEIDGFYFNNLAIEILKKTDLNYCMNYYYNLSISDILNLIDDNESLTDVKKSLFYEYKTDYANLWYNNFLEVLKRVKH